MGSSTTPRKPVDSAHSTRSPSRWSRLAILGMILVAAACVLPLYRGTMGHQAAYREPATTAAALPALVPRVILVIVDGLRYDLSEEMPCLQDLRARGAYGRSMASFPSFSQPTWTTLVSGARPEISGAALFNAAYESIEPIRVSTIFQMSHEAGLTTALAGQEWWSKMIPAVHLDYTHFVKEFDAEGDAEAAEAAVDLYQKPDVDLLVLYLGEYDELNHSVGALSAEAMGAIERSDRALCTLASVVDLSSTVLVVTADHGQIDAAGHGGDDRAVVEVPLVMAGPRVRPGSYPDVQQPDIPATIGALLGMPLPRSGQGRVLYEWLDVSEEEQARGETALAAQQAAWAGAYLESFGGKALSTVGIEIAEPEALLRAEDWSGARSAAAATRDKVLAHVARERAAQIARSRWLWLVPLLLGLGLVALLAAAQVRAHGWAPVAGALLGGAAYHGFYLLRGNVYSLSILSSVGSPLRLVLTLVLGAAIALAVGIGLIWLASRRPGARARPLSHSIPALCAALTALLLVIGLSAWLVNGRIGSWLLVSPKASFLAILSVIQVILAGLLGLVVMCVTALGSWLRRRARALPAVAGGEENR